jgi:hypothetical protein
LYNIGEILGKSNIDDNDWHSDDEDGHGGLDKEVVNSLHFGGFEPTKGKGANIYGPGKKSKIIKKTSKCFFET